MYLLSMSELVTLVYCWIVKALSLSLLISYLSHHEKIARVCVLSAHMYNIMCAVVPMQAYILYTIQALRYPAFQCATLIEKLRVAWGRARLHTCVVYVLSTYQSQSEYLNKGGMHARRLFGSSSPYTKSVGIIT